MHGPGCNQHQSQYRVTVKQMPECAGAAADTPCSATPPPFNLMGPHIAVAWIRYRVEGWPRWKQGCVQELGAGGGFRGWVQGGCMVGVQRVGAGGGSRRWVPGVSAGDGCRDKMQG